MKSSRQRRTFISYSRVNKEFAVKLAKELRASNFAIWLDQLDIPAGARWDDELEKALHDCEIFLIILTPESIASQNVKDEIGFAIDYKKRILPVLLEDCKIPLRLRRLQYADFTKKKYSDGIESAKQLLNGLIDQKSLSIPKATSVSEDQSNTKTSSAKNQKSSETIGDAMPAKKPGRKPAQSRGDVITISNQGNANAIAAGRGAKAFISHAEESADMNTWRKKMERSIDALKNLLPEDKVDLKENVAKVAEEVSKGEDADLGRIERLLNVLGGMSSDIFDVAVATLVNPLAGLGLVVKKMGDRAKLETK